MTSSLRSSRFSVPLAAVFLLYSFKTVTRNPVWRDNLTLFSTDAKTSSNSCKAHCLYGYELVDLGIAEQDPAIKEERFAQGTAELHAALRIYPRYADAFFKLGVAYQGLRADPDSAIYYYGRAIKEAPGSAILYNNLGTVYESLGRQELASYYYNMAVGLNPLFADATRNSEAHKKKTGLDIRILPVATDLDSLERTTPQEEKDQFYYLKLGNDLASQGDYARAAQALERAVSQQPDLLDALVNLGGCYGMLKDYPKSIETLNKVVALDPGNARAWGNLAVTYELIGQKDKAEECRERMRTASGQ